MVYVIYGNIVIYTILIYSNSNIIIFSKMQVLDEIHHHPMSDSVSMLSLPAPEDVVDSFPLRNYQKAEATENGAQ